MDVFISYKHTGESPTRLAELISKVKSSLVQENISFYCTYFDVLTPTDTSELQSAALTRALDKIDDCKCMLVVLDSDKKSEGMLVEIGYATAKNVPIFMLKNTNVTQSYLHSFVKRFADYQSFDDIYTALKSLQLGDFQ